MNKSLSLILASTLALALTFILGCSEKCDKFDPETQVCDERDGKLYKVVTIGEQIWMAENLNYKGADSIARCYDNNAANCKKFGRLYTWEAAKDMCPGGWHLPTDYEWAELALVAAPRAGAKLKTKEGWAFKNREKQEIAGGGTDELGFSALPGGYAYANGNFCNAGEESAEPCNYSKGAYWWSATPHGDDYAGVKYILHDAQEITQISGSKLEFRSVRCLKGDSAVAKAEAAKVECPEHDSKTHFCDTRDGRVYKQITVGKDIWMAENLNYAKGGECYEGKQENCDKYGRLYGHDMARGVCPENWHLATDSEWGNLINKFGGSNAGGKKLKAADGWNGALGGYGSKQGGFEDIGDFGGWWCTQTFSYDYHTFGYYIQNKSNSINHGNPYGNESGYCDSGDECKLATLSARCVKNTKCGDGYADPSNEQECCANKTVYDGFGQFCHKGKVYDKCGEVGGGDSYDPDTQFCFEWMEGLTPEKCGGKVYDFKKQFCHNKKIYDRCGNVESPEDGIYDPDLKICNNGELEFNYGKLSYGGKTYKTIKIGKHTWMAENLNFAAEGSKCADYTPGNNAGDFKDGNTDICDEVGRHYRWETAMAACPKGWHLPSNEEWDNLFCSVDGSNSCNEKPHDTLSNVRYFRLYLSDKTPYDKFETGKKLKDENSWSSASRLAENGEREMHEGKGTNDYGFSALASGFGSSDLYESYGYDSYWWSSSEADSTYAYSRHVSAYYDCAYANRLYKTYYLSVRCVKDN